VMEVGLVVRLHHGRHPVGVVQASDVRGDQ
jgi:hypothetical protein